MSKPYLAIIAIACACFLPLIGKSQVPPDPAAAKHPRTPTVSPFKPVKRLSTEICTNGIDDDGNGLADQKDPACYYSNYNPQNCLPSKVVWACSNYGISWADTETGEEGLVGHVDNLMLNDITWTADGKLYIVDYYQGAIFEIDPFAAHSTFISALPDYYFSNGMTSDNEGNLYLASYTVTKQWFIIKFNIITKEVTVVADLTESGAESAGDMVFVNGDLYLACLYGKIAKIDIKTHAVEVKQIKNPIDGAPFGMITLGDGFLYLSSLNSIYRLDPATLEVDQNPYYTFKQPDLYLYGLANYTEFCNAPGCHSKLRILSEKSQPGCADKGVLLVAQGTGITGNYAYDWTLPDGSSVRNDSLVALVSGRYSVRYHTLPDTCGKNAVIDVAVLQLPKVALGNDQVWCGIDSIRLAPADTSAITTYHWQDGSNLDHFNVTTPGQYILTASNVCGQSTDTVMVTQGYLPNVSLGADTLICPGATLQLINQLTPGPSDKYVWFSGSGGPVETVQKEGMYWLRSENGCGSTTDYIQVTYRDSCSCFPLYPVVDLGNDRAICSFETADLKNLSDRPGFTYLWSNGSTEKKITVTSPGQYWLDTRTYCATERGFVTVTQKTENCEREVYFPSAFSPDHDGKNDSFKPIIRNQLLHFEYSIYNRWGQLVFTTTSISSGWDGTVKGKLQESGTYIWRCSFQYAGLETVTRRGTLMLIR